MAIYLCDRVENTIEKGENAGYQRFSPFPTVFSTAFFRRSLCGIKLSTIQSVNLFILRQNNIVPSNDWFNSKCDETGV